MVAWFFKTRSLLKKTNSGLLQAANRRQLCPLLAKEGGGGHAGRNGSPACAKPATRRLRELGCVDNATTRFGCSRDQHHGRNYQDHQDQANFVAVQDKGFHTVFLLWRIGFLTGSFSATEWQRFLRWCLAQSSGLPPDCLTRRVIWHSTG